VRNGEEGKPSEKKEPLEAEGEIGKIFTESVPVSSDK